MRLRKISLMLVVSCSLVASALCSGCSRGHEYVYEGSVYSWKEGDDTIYGVAYYDDDRVLYFMSDSGVVHSGDKVLDGEVIDYFEPSLDCHYFPDDRRYVRHEEDHVYGYLNIMYYGLVDDMNAKYPGEFSNPIEMMRLSGR